MSTWKGMCVIQVREELNADKVRGQINMPDLDGRRDLSTVTFEGK